MNEKICRFCLKTISSNNWQAVEESFLKSLKLNINISKENAMCIGCANCLRVFSNFTLGCFYMGDRTLPLSELENGVKLDPEMSETTSNPKSLIEIKCHFCTKTHGREDLISLKESKEDKFLVNMLEQYISVTNLRTIEELLTCETCLEALRGGLSVISKCLEVRKKISKYTELEGTDDKGEIELKEVQQFTFRPKLKLEIELVGENDLEDRCDQIKEAYTTMAESEIKYEKKIWHPELIIKTECDDIASEHSECVITDIKSEQGDCDGFQDTFIEYHDPLHIPVVTSETRKCNEHIKQHLLTHKRTSELKCDLCSYKAKYKCLLARHLLTHKSTSELKMFKCDLCSYEAKHKYDLVRHLLTHKSTSELKMFQCDLCSYEAKHKYDLVRHLLTHKSTSELKMFQCALCSYESKHKSNLKIHSLTHKNPSEIKMFKCALCSYIAKQKSHLTQHLLTHKSPSEIKMFKCASCSYEAKYKSALKNHLLTHKTAFEAEMFKCELCSYVTKHKHALARHLLTHESPF